MKRKVEKLEGCENNALVYKSNEFIDAEYVGERLAVGSGNEIVDAQWGLSAAAQKVTAVLISKVDPLKDGLPVFRMSIPEFADVMGISRQAAYKMAEGITFELKAVQLALKSPVSAKITRLSLFRQSEYDLEEGTVGFEFESRLEKHLRDFSGNFTRYQVKQIKCLNSRYAIRLYEILRKAHPMNSKRVGSVVTIELKRLKSMLGIRGDSKTYNVYSNFRRFVLEVAQRKLESDTDLKFTFDPVRQGRKISAIRFYAQHNKIKPAEPIEGEFIEKTTLVSREKVSNLRAFIPSLPESAAAYLIANYEQDRLTEACLAYTQAVVSGTKIEKPGAYLLAILRNQRREDEHWKSQQPTNYTTEEMLDTSWADEFHFQFEEDV